MTQVAALSTEAQAAYAQIKAVLDAATDSEDKESVKTQIDAILAGVSDSVKAELDTLKVRSRAEKPEYGSFSRRADAVDRRAAVADPREAAVDRARREAVEDRARPLSLLEAFLY